MQFIFGSELAAKVVHLVENSRKLLLLVSPYFDPWDHLAIEIQNAAAVRRVDTRLVVRGGDDRVRQEPATARFTKAGAKVHFLERLHAKLYMNEDEAIVTSMNLLKSSAFGSWELAVRLVRTEDPEQFAALGDCVRKLLEHVKAEEERLRVLQGASAHTFDPFLALGQVTSGLSIESSTRAPAQKELASAPAVAASPVPAAASTAHCVRCGIEGGFGVQDPFCEKHSRVWHKTADRDQQEYYCYQCGSRAKTSQRQPRCDTCLGAAG